MLDVNGDGNADYSGTGNPPATRSYTYTTAGNYSVAFMVSDNRGANATATRTVNAGSANQPPTCSLIASPNSGNAPLSVTFTLSATDPEGALSTWVLDANGDGTIDYSGNGNPPSTRSFTFSNPGTYTAVLMVSDNNNATASAVT